MLVETPQTNPIRQFVWLYAGMSLVFLIMAVISDVPPLAVVAIVLALLALNRERQAIKRDKVIRSIIHDIVVEKAP